MSHSRYQIQRLLCMINSSSCHSVGCCTLAWHGEIYHVLLLLLLAFLHSKKNWNNLLFAFILLLTFSIVVVLTVTSPARDIDRVTPVSLWSTGAVNERCSLYRSVLWPCWLVDRKYSCSKQFPNVHRLPFYLLTYLLTYCRLQQTTLSFCLTGQPAVGQLNRNWEWFVVAYSK